LVVRDSIAGYRSEPKFVEGEFFSDSESGLRSSKN
jgi:hypothetical protein